jgi:hypothetical protein
VLRCRDAGGSSFFKRHLATPSGTGKAPSRMAPRLRTRYGGGNIGRHPAGCSGSAEDFLLRSSGAYECVWPHAGHSSER